MLCNCSVKSPSCSSLRVLQRESQGPSVQNQAAAAQQQQQVQCRGPGRSRLCAAVVRKHCTDEGTVADSCRIFLRLITVTHQTTWSSFPPPGSRRRCGSFIRRGSPVFSSGRLNGSSSRGSGRAVGGQGREPAVRGRSIRWWGHGCGS